MNKTAEADKIRAADPRMWEQERVVNELGEILAGILDESTGQEQATTEQASVLGDDTDSLRTIVGAFWDAGYALNIQAMRRE